MSTLTQNILKAALQTDRLVVAAYYRKSPASKDSIEASIEQQMEQVREYARQKGWIIAAEYTDGGKSGSRDQEERTEFLRMLDDAGKGQWNAILVWHSNRFARLDILDVAQYVVKLRDADVHIESVREGKIAPKSKQGKMMLFMTSETNNDFSVNVSGDSIRGRIDAINAGAWPHGTTPWGYDKAYFEGATLKMTVPRHEKFQKPGNWEKRLTTNPSEAESIRWILSTYANTDISIRHLARETSKRGILTPRGMPHWSLRSIVEVLTNPVYAGDTCIGVRRSGNKKGKFTQAKATTKASSPAIVSRETFAAVQAKIAARKETGKRTHTGRAGVLSGILICGHCGYGMATHHQKATNEKGERFYTGKIYHTCNSPQVRPSMGCKQWRAVETEILPAILEKLVEGIDGAILRSIMAKPEDKPQQTDALKAKIDELEKVIAVGGENLLRANAITFPILQQKLEEVTNERDKCRNTLDLIEQDADQTENARILKWWDSRKGQLVRLKDGQPLTLPKDANGTARCTLDQMTSVMDVDAEPAVVRDLLKRLNTTVTLTWTPNGKRHYKLAPGILRADFGEHVLTGHKNIPN